MTPRSIVNLFIPSALDWQGNRVALDTRYPFSEAVTLTIEALDRPLAVRLPGWCERPALTVNGEAAAFERRGGYAVLNRRWRKGDRITLNLPMTLRAEPTPDDPDMIAFAHGPVVLAADLGPASEPFDSLPPALVTGDALGRARPVDAAAHRFAVPDARPRGALARSVLRAI